MRAAAIIAEYNPFHNGHAYHIQKTREMGYTHIVAVMSGSIVQRGDMAIADPHERAKAAIKGGCDLVIELPVPYSCASAKDFARSACQIVKGLQVIEALSFGSECGDVKRLTECARALDSADYAKVKELMSAGNTYPQALSKVLGGFEDVLDGANNVLALEYIRALSGSGIDCVTVPRSVAHDGGDIRECFASASNIREMIKNGEDASLYMPWQIEASDVSFIEEAEKAILFKLSTMTREELDAVPYSGDGVASRIYKSVKGVWGINELFEAVKTRNVTHARVRRAVLLAALGVTKTDMEASVPYARVIAANDRGVEVLSQCKNRATIPVSASLKELSCLSEQAGRCAYLTDGAAYLRHLSKRVAKSGYTGEFSRTAYWESKMSR